MPRINKGIGVTETYFLEGTLENRSDLTGAQKERYYCLCRPRHAV